MLTMTSLTMYSVHTVLLATLLGFLCLRKRALDLYLFGIISFWVISVIFIYARYKSDQIYFYSNDQAYHLQIITYYIPHEGFKIGLEELLNRRYPVTIPTLMLSKLGIDIILANKFIQLVYLVLTYSSGRSYLARNQISPRWWHVALFCGPIIVFNSSLALRDVSIAYFVILLVLEANPTLRTVGLIGTTLLRPHLTISLLVGLIISRLFKNINRRYFIPALTFLTITTYALGSYAYFFGATIKDRVPLRAPTEIFAQFKFTRLAANFVSLQFLTLDETIVAASIPALFLSRLVFFDTVLTPVLFIVILLQPSTRWNELRTSIFFAFIFFYGIISQTEWNSSRQNIPFFVIMGLVTVVGMNSRKAHLVEASI